MYMVKFFVKNEHENKFPENQETELWLANGGKLKTSLVTRASA